MSKVKLNPDQELVQEIRRKLKQNGGYCPCAIIQDKDSKCPCKDFREKSSGECHCGLYIKFPD